MQPKHSHKWWFYIVTPIMSIALTIVLIEVSFTILYPIPFSVASNMYFVTDRFTGYRLKPNSIGYFQQQILARTNKHGHRDDLVSIEKPEGVFRILLLGDSFTVGANVAQDATYAKVLEILLNKNNTTSVEVINSGVGGWEPFQYAQYYEHYGRKFSPDLILIGFFVGNDAYGKAKNVQQTPTAILGRIISRKAKLDPLIHLKVFLYNHSNMARFLLTKEATIGNVTRKNCSDFSSKYIITQRNRLKNHLKRSSRQQKSAENGIYQIRRIKELAERDSIPLGVILIPDEMQINMNLQQFLLSEKEGSKFDFEMPQSMLLDMFNAVAIPVVDLLPFFKEDSRCLYMNDTHLSPEGHTLAATVIYNNITSGKIWPNLMIK